MVGVYSAGRPDAGATRDLRRMTHKTIRKVTGDLERFHFNTMVAALMEYTNYLTTAREERSVEESAWQEAINALLLLLAPTAPHLAEELWVETGHPYSIHQQPFPGWDAELAAEEEFTLVIQVNGKLRDRVSVPVAITEEEARSLALSRERIRVHLNDRKVGKVIYVPRRLVNVVTA